MTKEQKLALANRLMNIEFKHSPVTGSRNSLRIGLPRGQKAKKYTEKEIAGIRAFYLTDPILPVAGSSAGRSKTTRKTRIST